jgi:hypothetical protein
MQLSTGLGMPPDHAVVLGGLVRMQTRFGDGSDLGLYVRTATRGYVQGGWGAALDLGGHERLWGATGPGVGGALSLGAPWGITLNLDAAYGPERVRTYAAVVGVDFARFTVYRGSGLSWWSNPFPSPRRD